MGVPDTPAFSVDCTSLLKKHLTASIWRSLCDLQTASGYSFLQAIRSGVEQQDSAIGVYAGDEESYSLFAPLLTPIIREYHGSGGPHPEADFSTGSLPQVSAAASEKILSTRIRVGRNLAGYPLGPAISREQRNEVERQIRSALHKLPASVRGEYLPLTAMDENLRQKLVARHLLFKSEDRFLESANLMRDWPEGRGLFIAQDERFSAWVNEEDQLRIIALQPGGDVNAVFQLLADGVSALGRQLDFLRSPTLGFLASCPTNLGTAMRASVHMRLDRLATDESTLKQRVAALGLQARGVHGEHSRSEGGVYDISNRMRLGITEAAAVSHLINGINALAEEDLIPAQKADRSPR